MEQEIRNIKCFAGKHRAVAHELSGGMENCIPLMSEKCGSVPKCKLFVGFSLSFILVHRGCGFGVLHG